MIRVIMMVIIVVVRIIVVAIVLVAMLMVMVMIVQQEYAEQIDCEPQHRDRNGLPEPDGDRIDEAHHQLIADQQRHHSQDNGARERRQLAELAGTEREPIIIDVPAGEIVGDGGDGKRRHMGRHVQAVGDQRHGAEQRAAADLGDHHHDGEENHRPGPAFMQRVLGTQKVVGVLPLCERLDLHARPPWFGLL